MGSVWVQTDQGELVDVSGCCIYVTNGSHMSYVRCRRTASVSADMVGIDVKSDELLTICLNSREERGSYAKSALAKLVDAIMSGQTRIRASQWIPERQQADHA